MGRDIKPKSLVQSPRDRATIIAALLAIVVAVAALFFALQSQKGETQDERSAKVEARSDAQQATAEKVGLAEKVRRACADTTKKQREDLGSLCNQAKQIVQGEQGIPGAQGPAGPPPSDAQVQQAVALYCAGGTCQGSGPTEAQVRAAVATYCNANGDCKGPAGENGAAGQDGAPGAAGSDGTQGPAGKDGTDGKNATDEQVAAAVASYCESHDCGEPGPKGDTGDTGPQGPAGPQGEPGPTCPDGYSGRNVQVESGQSPINNDTQTIFACVPNA